MLRTDDDLTNVHGGPTVLQSEVFAALQANLSRGYLESEERFRQIVEGLNDVVWLSDSDRAVVFFVNAAYERIWGRTRESLYADSLGFLDGVHPDDRPRVRDFSIGDARRNGDIEFRVLRPDGGLRWVWGRSFPVRNRDGEVYRIATVVEDISERKTITESHDRLLRGFTHDVKNPLGVADGSLSLLEMGIGGELNHAQMEHVARARRSIRTALNLVFQLLEIQRAASGEIEVARIPVKIGAVLHECVEDFRVAAAAKQQDLFMEGATADDGPHVQSDRPRVRQILANLVSNAVKYTGSGGSIRVAARAAVDGDPDAPRPGHWLAIDVADTGLGIPPEKKRLLFREFTRFTPATAEGSGIGLAISQHLARALGGAITVRSTLGLGSTFTLWLPDPS